MAFGAYHQTLAAGATAVMVALQSGLVLAQSGMPTNGTVSANPYGALTVTGGTLNGATITGLSSGAVIQLGSVPGSPGSFAEIDFQSASIGPGNSLTIRAGAAGQTLILVNKGATSAAIQGSLEADAGGATAPILYLHSASGINVDHGASILATSGLVVDALADSSWTVGQPIVNQGTIDGGSNLRLLAAKVNGGGTFKADAIEVGTFGSANNPVNGSHFLANGLQLRPGTGSDVALTINDFGASPQFLNFTINGDARVAMPSAWPSGSTKPTNDAGLPFGGSRPPGAPEPSYGGGSLIIQATGSLTLDGGTSGDLTFPGGLVLRAGGTLNVGSVLLNQGWTTTGRAFQGVFLESPNIVGSETFRVLSNNLNWVNFSTVPHVPVSTWTLVQMPDGSVTYAAADAAAPHLNTYSTLANAAADGECWTCLINPVVASLQGPLSALSIAPIANPSEGDFIQLQPVDSAGNPLPASSVKWTTSDSTRAVVTAKGLLMVLGPGEVGITAEAGAQASTLSLTLQDRQYLAGPLLVMLGPREVVFDYDTDRCETFDVPDNPARATRLADQSILFLDTNDPRNRITTGADFDSLKRVCAPIYTSTDDPTPSSFKNREWIWSTYRVGNVVHALIHNEYHDPVDPGCAPGNSAPGNPCWYNSITYAVSTDSGRTFVSPPSPSHVIAPPIRRWDPNAAGARSIPQGSFTPSNIVARNDGYFYALFTTIPVSTLPMQKGICVMRTMTLDDPSSWRAWDGSGYNLAMLNPYLAATPAQPCKQVIAAGGTPSVTYNSYLQLYVLVVDENFIGYETQCGFSYYLSPDLVAWTPGVLFKATYLSAEPPCRNPGGYAGNETYPSFLDHASTSINFETSGQAVYLYFTEFTSNINGVKRNVVRQPVILLKSKSQGADYSRPAANLERPQLHAAVSGSSYLVGGWAFDNDVVTKVDMLLDGNVIGTATYGLARPDVVQANPGATLNCGFEFVLDSTGFANGDHIIAMRAVDPTGNQTTMRVPVTFAN